jgi:excisionase family DNA binding protein
MGRISIDDYPQVMTSADVAELLGHPIKQIQFMAREGRLPARRRPGTHQWRFPRDELIAWLRSDETRVEPAAE